MRRWVFIAIFLLLAAGIATADIYRWTDERGKLHFAQSLDQVPPRYRDHARAPTGERGSFQTYTRSPHARVGLSSRTFRIPFRSEGSLMRVTALVNGHLDIPFYIDTGASGLSLPVAYVQRLGIAVDGRTERITVRTANGVIEVPLVRIDSVALGGARVEGLMATVNPTMQIGLLGGAFFNNFSYRVDPAANVITLEPNHAVQSGLGEHHWQRRFREVRSPLDELERYLEDREISRKGRRAELEGKLAALRQRLADLERDADRDNIPVAWRH